MILRLENYNLKNYIKSERIFLVIKLYINIIIKILKNKIPIFKKYYYIYISAIILFIVIFMMIYDLLSYFKIITKNKNKH